MNNNIIPVITYTNLSKNKYLILRENKNKSGIYRWNNLGTAKSYVGSSIYLKNRLTIYYTEEKMRKVLV
jgi:excinuclease UvrABC nuclease subunit